MKPQPIPQSSGRGGWEVHKNGAVFPFWDGTGDVRDTRHHLICPYGQPGDRLWVRETFAPYPEITLEIVSVRVERLQEISVDGVKAEGVGCPIPYPAYCDKGFPEHFVEYWNSIAKPGQTWTDNPWVWVVEFKRV